MNPRFWSTKCVFISGASSGIGEALARRLAGMGARLGLVARRIDTLDKLAREAGSARSAKIVTAQADVGSAEQAVQALGRLEKQLGPADVAIANAGLLRYTPPDHINLSTARALLDTNLGGVMNFLSPLLPGMIERRSGCVAAVSSVAPLFPVPGVCVYAAVKAGVIAWMRSLAVGLAPYGVRTTTVCPGFVHTPMVAHRSVQSMPLLLSADEAAKRILRAIERGRRLVYFPRRIRLAAALLGVLPFSWQWRLISRATREEAPLVAADLAAEEERQRMAR